MLKFINLISIQCIIGGVFLLFSGQAWAFELKPSLSYTWWHYAEQDTIPARYGGGKINSQAQNWAIVPSLDIMQDTVTWHHWASLESILASTATETFPSYQQQNRLSIKQWRAEAGSDYRIGKVGVGIWAGYQQQTQSRSLFFIRGSRVFIPGGEPIHETITVLLAGARITSAHKVPDAGTFLLHLKAGLPLSVRMRNSLPQITDTFHSRKGWEDEVGMSWQTSQLSNKINFELSALYRYRRLGGEAKPTAYWPVNTWQRAQIMMSFIW